MPHIIKVSPHKRRRPVTEKMRVLLDKLGIPPAVSIEMHERSYTPPMRRLKPAKNPKDGKARKVDPETVREEGE